jgi:HEAT repeat protein
MIKSKKYEKKGKKTPSSSATPIQSLIADLRSRDGILRRKARQTLVSIGKQGVPQLIPLLKESEDDIRWEAAKTLAEIGDTGAATELVDMLEDHNFGIRWLAAEGLIAIGREALLPVLKALTKCSDSAWLREGAHHVLHDLAGKDLGVKKIVAPVIAALEGIEPEIGVLEPAFAALDRLKSLPKKAGLKKGLTSEAKSWLPDRPRAGPSFDRFKPGSKSSYACRS